MLIHLEEFDEDYAKGAVQAKGRISDLPRAFAFNQA